MFDKLGKKVCCSGYYKRIKDGLYIECYDKDNYLCADTGKSINKAVVIINGKIIKELDFDGSGEIKTLYKYTTKRFIGICVGEIKLCIKELLFANIGYHYNGEEYLYIGKTPTEIVDCYIVYYVNNRKRYVPKTKCII